MTGANELRHVVRMIDDWPESFNDRFTAGELLMLAAALRASDWEIGPWLWTSRQLADALRGHAPRFVETERGEFRPVYERRGKRRAA